MDAGDGGEFDEFGLFVGLPLLPAGLGRVAAILKKGFVLGNLVDVKQGFDEMDGEAEGAAVGGAAFASLPCSSAAAPESTLNWMPSPHMVPYGSSPFFSGNQLR